MWHHNTLYHSTWHHHHGTAEWWLTQKVLVCGIAHSHSLHVPSHPTAPNQIPWHHCHYIRSHDSIRHHAAWHNRTLQNITWRDKTGIKWHHGHYVKSHGSIWHHIAWHDRTLQNITSHDVTRQETKRSQHITWHVAINHINSPQVTSQPSTLLHLNHATDLMTPMTSQPWNGRRLVHGKNRVWASRWSVALRTFLWANSFFAS